MEEMTVTQVAEILGKTDRTIRNYIKEGRIKARHVENQFGWEYRVYDLGEFASAGTPPEKPAETPLETIDENKTEIAFRIVSRENQRLWEEYKQLREANNRLAYDLGVRDQRIKELEQSLEKALSEVKKSLPVGPETAVPAAEKAGNSLAKIPWWKRLFRH